MPIQIILHMVLNSLKLTIAVITDLSCPWRCDPELRKLLVNILTKSES
ncbi:hypothetical protein [Photobacterium leiognathi]|nr:hypothetical protein [Photobacterium leiognathi]